MTREVTRNQDRTGGWSPREGGGSPSRSWARSSASSRVATPIAKDPGAATSKLSNLLYTTDAAVAVSSKVDNPKDFPEHLVDGKPETAWNGKTGDLRGWIAFRIPPNARIAWITLSTGFDKNDLFTQNHRIKKIRIMRNKENVREVDLDVEQRAPQKIPLAVDGGEIRIDVLETVPGTKKEWKELTVSELAVWGDPRDAKLPAPFLEIRSVMRTDTRTRTSNVAVRTKKGLFFTHLDLAVEDLRNPGCAGGCTQQRKSVEVVTTPKGPALATVVDEHCWNNPWPSADGEGTPGSSTYRERAEVCTVSDAGERACTAYDVSTTEAKYREYEDDFGRVPWSSPKRRRTRPTGELVFE
jgi:hypothetical protein